jgi:hypothetical protein
VRTPKNGDRRMKRAESMSTSPAITIPISDQICDAGAPCSDLATIQARNPAAPTGSSPRVTASQTLMKMRCR